MEKKTKLQRSHRLAERASSSQTHLQITANFREEKFGLCRCGERPFRSHQILRKDKRATRRRVYPIHFTRRGISCRVEHSDDPSCRTGFCSAKRHAPASCRRIADAKRSSPKTRQSAFNSSLVTRHMSLLIKNGEIVTADERYVADIFCEDETITRIDRKIDNVRATKLSMPRENMFSPGSSIRTCTFICRSWARSRRTRTRPRAARRLSAERPRSSK